MLPVILAQGGRWTTIEKDIKRLTNTETTLDKKKEKKESPPVSENIHPTRCRMERRREKLRRRRKSINNETFIKASSGASSARQGQPANAGGFAVFGILRWHWQEVVSSYASGLTKTLKNNPLFFFLNFALYFVHVLWSPEGKYIFTLCGFLSVYYQILFIHAPNVFPVGHCSL